MPARPQKGRTGVSAGQPPRWRWDLNPRWTFTHTCFRVLRTHVRRWSSASASCSTRPSTTVTEPARTTTNETRTETKGAASRCLTLRVVSATARESHLELLADAGAQPAEDQPVQLHELGVPACRTSDYYERTLNFTNVQPLWVLTGA